MDYGIYYIVFSSDFQKIGTEDFADVPTFVRVFTEIMIEKTMLMELDDGEELMEPIVRISGIIRRQKHERIVCAAKQGLCKSAKTNCTDDR